MKASSVLGCLVLGAIFAVVLQPVGNAGAAAPGAATVERSRGPADHGANGFSVRQAGESSVYIVDIAATERHGPGRLIVNLDRKRFLFHGRGFHPDTQYALHYRLEGDGELRWFASGVATRSGTLRVRGTWSGDLSTLQGATFAASSLVLIIPNMPVIAKYNDYCLGPYYRIGGFFVTEMIQPLVVGTEVSLIPTGEFYLYCNRYVQGVFVDNQNGVTQEAYMFPVP